MIIQDIIIMQLNIESPDVPIDDRLLKLVMNNFSHIGKMYDRIVKCQVILKKVPDNHKKEFGIEACLVLPGYSLFAEDKAVTFEIALHKVINNIIRQLRRYKSKRGEIW
ncbi:MAG: ribosome-associated translation inhibitor RaiA [Bacteroidota bacterium]|nr:ribosome-associated translation inhibitor RaiA [Bacteroidota bacterium]